MQPFRRYCVTPRKIANKKGARAFNQCCTVAWTYKLVSGLVVVLWHACALFAQTAAQHNQVKLYPMSISATPYTQHIQDILLLSKDESRTWVECSCAIFMFAVEDRWKMQATHMKSHFLHPIAKKYRIDCWKIEFLCSQEYGNARN